MWLTGKSSSPQPAPPAFPVCHLSFLVSKRTFPFVLPVLSNVFFFFFFFCMCVWRKSFFLRKFLSKWKEKVSYFCLYDTILAWSGRGGGDTSFLHCHLDPGDRKEAGAQTPACTHSPESPETWGPLPTVCIPGHLWGSRMKKQNHLPAHGCLPHGARRGKPFYSPASIKLVDTQKGPRVRTSRGRFFNTGPGEGSATVTSIYRSLKARQTRDGKNTSAYTLRFCGRGHAN